MKKRPLLFPALIFLCTILTADLFAQVPTSSFVLSSYTACTGSSIQVTDASLNTPTAWSYSVNGGFVSSAQSPELTFTASGTYTIDQESTNGSGTGTVFSQTVLVDPIPVLTVSGSTLICTSSNSTLQVSGADTYTWDSGSQTNVVTITPSVTTVYSVSGTNTLTGCSNKEVSTVSVIPLPTISIANTSVCAGNVYTFAPSGASSYTFSGGSNTINPSATANYTVSGTDSQSGCSNSTVVTITVVTPSISVSGTTICEGETFTISPDAEGSYTVSGGTPYVSPTVTTVYTVTTFDSMYSCIASETVAINVNPAPTIIANSGTICAGSVFIINPTGASSYTYSSGSDTVSPTTNTVYQVSGVSGTNVCVGVTNVSITVNPLPFISVNSGSICVGNDFVMTPTGAYTYTFSSGTATVSPSIATAYSVTGADAFGCASQNTAVAYVTITGLAPVLGITSSASGNTVMCEGEKVILTAGGANTYTWNTGAVSQSIAITPTVTSIFVVDGTSVNGCTSYTQILMYVYNCSGIDENQSQNIQLNYYPNPFKDEFKIETSADTEITVYNTLGTVVCRRKLAAGENTISLSDQPQGVYFISTNRQERTFRIIKY